MWQWLGIGTLGSASHGVLANHSSLGSEAGAELSIRSRAARAKVTTSYRNCGWVGVGISWVNVGFHTLCTGGGSGRGLERGGQDTGQGA